MNIWVIGRSYPLKKNKMSGSFELEQAKLLAKHGHQVSYIAAIFHPFKKVKKWGYCEFEDDSVKVFTESVFYAPERMHLHMKRFQKKIWELLLNQVKKKQGIPDIIHVHYPAMITIPDPVLAYQKEGSRIVLTEHWSKTMLNTMDTFQRKQLIQYVDTADAIISVGTPLKQAILNITGTKREIQVVPNIVSSLFCYNPTVVPGKTYNFVTVGRLDPIKQIDKITQAFAENFAGKNNIHLTIIGDGDERKRIEKTICDNNIQSQVTLMGTLPREETANLISKADSLVCFSRYETFGVPVIEAWACGKPVIGTNRMGMTEVWNDELGYVVHYDRIDELKQAMIKIYENREKYNSPKIAAFAKEHFGEEAVYKLLLDIYKSI